MKRLGLLLLTVLLAACNLTTEPVDTPPTATEAVEQTSSLPASVTPLGVGSQPTLAPPPVANTPTMPSGTLCMVYTTYSGSDPNNLLSLRAQPSVSATQVIKLPNNASVFRFPNSKEILADGYHWLNIIYIDTAQNRFQGWTARDSFEANGVRDSLIATLRATNQQAAC
ncbi:MAG: hypothetical protein ABI690_07505 [Chloroflexota bacterium]